MYEIDHVSDVFGVENKDITNSVIKACKENAYKALMYLNGKNYLSGDIVEELKRKDDYYTKALLSEEQIIQNAINNIPLGSPLLNNYIYFLINDFRIVYVGQTTNILQRISQHHLSGKGFDSVSLIDIESKKLLLYETLYIRKLNPILNKTEFNNLDYFKCILRDIDFNF